MDLIIGFFRDVLDGPLYIIVTIICVILICSCIGYLAEQSLNKKKKKKEYEETHATVSNTASEQQPVQNINQNMLNQTVPTNQPIQAPITPQPTAPTIDIATEMAQVSNPIEQLNSQVSDEISQLAQPITDFANQPVPSTIEMPTGQIPEQPATPSLGGIVQQPQVPNPNIGFVEPPQPTMIQTPNNQ